MKFIPQRTSTKHLHFCGWQTSHHAAPTAHPTSTQPGDPAKQTRPSSGRPRPHPRRNSGARWWTQVSGSPGPVFTPRVVQRDFRDFL
ncbi:hypothetical protein MTP99_016386 [Tenebrio molitor]|nr:hypothetical protein MTP99_016386 [Tenebrio molitor]